jgi:hypothetical protein
MLKVTVNGVDHELSPDSPRATSHSALLKDIVTSVNALETGTSPDGIELSSTDAADNVITSASDNTTTTGSVAALTFKTSVAHAANDLEFNFVDSGDASLMSIDNEGDVVAAGTVTAAGVVSSAATAVSASGATANVITSAASDANTTTSVAGLTFKNTVAHTSGDLEFDFQKSTGGSLFKIKDTGAGIDNIFFDNATTVNGAGYILNGGYDYDGQNILTVKSANALTHSSATNSLQRWLHATTEKLKLDAVSAKLDYSVSEFTDDSANTGNRTVNKVSGINAFAGGSAAITITNDRCNSATCIVNAVLQTNDATAILKNVVPTTGSFTINLTAAATGTTKVAWWIINS